MAEILAAGMTGSLLSRDVKPLKSPKGTPHDLGQYYLLIDPSCSEVFQDRLTALAGFVDMDAGTRIPGRSRVSVDPVEVVPKVWNRLEELARGPRPSE
jgi:(2R)-3-sulfolactate dehydrogenase (NADP+)